MSAADAADVELGSDEDAPKQASMFWLNLTSSLRRQIRRHCVTRYFVGAGVASCAACWCISYRSSIVKVDEVYEAGVQFRNSSRGMKGTRINAVFTIVFCLL